jgi:hypothetical protein
LLLDSLLKKGPKARLLACSFYVSISLVGAVRIQCRPLLRFWLIPPLRVIRRWFWHLRSKRYSPIGGISRAWAGSMRVCARAV